MARYFDIVGGGNATDEAGLVLHGSGFMFLLCMIAMSVSIMSMIIFACGQSSGKPHRSGGGFFGGGGAAWGDAGGAGGGDVGGGGCGGGGGGGGGCGGGGGGGGCGGGGGGGC